MKKTFMIILVLSIGMMFTPRAHAQAHYYHHVSGGVSFSAGWNWGVSVNASSNVGWNTCNSGWSQYGNSNCQNNQGWQNNVSGYSSTTTGSYQSQFPNGYYQTPAGPQRRVYR